MQHLNYCRQMVKQFSEFIEIPSAPPELRQMASHCIDLAAASQKFMLPDGGRLYDDPEYKALDETQPLNLPYPAIAIEFHRSKEYIGSRPQDRQDGLNSWQPSKGLLFARQREDRIALTMAVWHDSSGTWVPYPEVSIGRTHYIDRGATRRHGYVPIKIFHPLGFPAGDYMDEVGALLCMLNILSCKNVGVELSRPPSFGRKIKAALPFDSYHVLMVAKPTAGAAGSGGHHRSPREHLRRGHIRHIESGAKIWVNATVVNAGVGGKVTKDYAIT